MVGLNVKPVPIALVDIDFIGVKAPQFSFTRLHGADPTLGVEMASTGEVACFGTDMHEAFLKALLASGFKMPKIKRTVLISIGNDDMRREFLDSAKTLQDLGYHLLATPGTAAYFASHGIKTEILFKPKDKGEPKALDYLSAGQIELLINISDLSNSEEISCGYRMRRAAVDFGTSLVTNIKCAVLLVQAFNKVKKLELHDIDEYYSMPTVGWSTGTTLMARKMSIC